MLQLLAGVVKLADLPAELAQPMFISKIIFFINKCRGGGTVYALALGASVRKDVWVQIPPSA